MNNIKFKGELVLVGHIGVDAGLCWIGDPCYILHRQNGLPESIGKDWGEFCKTFNKTYPRMKSYTYDMGHKGLGVCVSTGFGDGDYPVYAIIEKHSEWGERIMGVFVDFNEIIKTESEE